MASDAVNPSAGAVPGPIRGEIQPQRWIPDERDGFIAWLRAEFAAANAIIDALCQHLQVIAGSPGEYDLVLACIQQRRFSWNPILHMQHYYSVGEVILALQQVGLSKFQAMESLGKASQFHGSSTEQVKDDLREAPESFGPDSSRKLSILEEKGEEEEEALTRKASTLSGAEKAASKSFPSAAENYTPKFIVGLEDVEGQQVNVLEGLELYENVADGNATANLLALVTQTHIMKRDGGRKRSSSIQFGTIPSEIIAEEQEGDLPPVPREQIVSEGGGVPPFLEFLLESVLKLRKIPSGERPNSCSISVFEPGDFMPLRAYHSFHQPVYMISLTESVLTFGRDLSCGKNPEKQSAGRLFHLTLTPGSLLVLQRNGLELVRCAISPSRIRQVLVAFGRLKATSTAQGTLSRRSTPESQQSPSPASGRWSTGTGVFLPANGVANSQ